jgi:murein DD-endopeptidase
MKSRSIGVGLLAILISIAAIVCEPRLVAANGGRSPLLTVQVVRAPDLMVAFGNGYLVYELALTSYDSSPIKVVGLRVIDADAPKTEFNFFGAQLVDMVRPVTVSETTDATIIETGQVRLVYVWLPFLAAERAPRRLAHFVRCRVKREGDEEYEIEVPPMAVPEASPPSIGPPLRGSGWIAAGAPSNNSYHRRARWVLNGVLYFAQRYAIDFEKVSPEGVPYAGDPKKNHSYLCYGAEVLAVADGRVVALKDGVPENVPDPVARAVKMTMETVGGNFVALDIGHGRYALYGHLIPGSLKVKLGNLVKRGRVLAHLGNSGNSTEPHLHFHIADAPSFLAANGLPYLYDQVDVTPGQVIDPKSDPPVIRPNGPAQRYLATMLLENNLVGFAR